MANQDAIELLTQDHRTVEMLFGQYQTATGDRRRELAEEIIKDLSVHAAIEEQMLYPGVRQALPNGDDLANEALSEHAQVKELLDALEGKRGDKPEAASIIERVKNAVRHHVDEEEGRLFPALRQHLSAELLRGMGESMAKAKSMAPTRPHPAAPDTPPGNLIAGPAVAMIDKVRDAARDAMQSLRQRVSR